MAEYDKACGATAGQRAMVGMMIGVRAARACDVCGKGRARWYCAPDLAYLCERCDGAVHSANAVAGRHERVRLGPDGAPLKMTQTPSAHVKHDVPAAVSPRPPAHFNPRKRPRSIRRHKRSSFHASKHVISSSILESNHKCIYTSTGSILASTHGIMINNPRNNPDFIANNIDSNELLNKDFIVKAEPYSPVDIGDQVKVPDHIDDDHLLESLFDFRDLQDDDLFLHEVPIYNPLQKQDLSSNLHGEQSAVKEEKEDEDKKPMIINISGPFPNCSDQDNYCANTQSSGLFNQVEDRKGLSFGLSPEEINEASSSLAECKDIADQSIDPDQDICDLDQLDFDCVLDGDDEDSDGMDNTPMDMDINSDAFMDGYDPCHAITHNDGFAEVSYIDQQAGNCNMDDADAQYNGEHHDAYVAGFNFNATGSESPRTWLCKVKVENPPELGIIHSQHGDFYDDALLREKLTCGADSPNTFKLGLKLNFEDVLSSWSDKGTFWTDGQPPSQITNCLDLLGGCLVPETMSGTGIDGDGQQLVPVLNHKNKRSDGGAREASVLRYREKRRTRLFSKKIRYEVRKLNAEKRPRMKGRFVKRMTIL